MALLRIILALVVISAVFRLLARLVFPIVLKHFIRKTAEQHSYRPSNTYKKEGEVTIVRKKTAPQSGSATEYTDYEELS